MSSLALKLIRSKTIDVQGVEAFSALIEKLDDSKSSKLNDLETRIDLIERNLSLVMTANEFERAN